MDGRMQGSSERVLFEEFNIAIFIYLVGMLSTVAASNARLPFDIGLVFDLPPYCIRTDCCQRLIGQSRRTLNEAGEAAWSSGY